MNRALQQALARLHVRDSPLAGVAGVLVEHSQALARVRQTQVRDFVQLSGQTLVVAGQVNADGTKLAGSGFTVARDSLGKYTVTFSAALGAVPQVAPALVVDGNYIISLTAVAATGFSVQVRIPGGAYADQPWQFVAQQ